MINPESAPQIAANQPPAKTSGSEAALTFPKKEISWISRPFGLMSAVGQMMKVDVLLFSMFPGKIGKKAREYLSRVKTEIGDFWKGRRDYTKEEYDGLTQEEKDDLWERAEANKPRAAVKKEQNPPPSPAAQPQVIQPNMPPSLASEQQPRSPEDVNATLERFKQQYLQGGLKESQWKMILSAAQKNYGVDVSQYPVGVAEPRPEQQLQNLAGALPVPA